jgi:Amidohydrolase family
MLPAMVLLASLGPAGAVAEEVRREPLRFENGLWFDGSGFVPRTVETRAGLLDLTAMDNGTARIIDPQGAYVVPPYCEAHNHNLGVGDPEGRGARYLAGGVFYIQILNDAPYFSHQEEPVFARPDTVDVTFAHGGLTGPGGHPVELLEGIKRAGGYPGLPQLKDQAYFEIADLATLSAKWPLLLESKPDLVKIFLQFSEEYEKRKDDPAYAGNRGLDPSLVGTVVSWAHRDGLRVAAHVTSATDFGVAVRAGVDIIAHLPGFMTPERIAPEDARVAARLGITVITTAALADSLAKESGDLERIQSLQKENLEHLRNAGVRLAIGSDNWADDSHREVQYLRELGVFSDLELLEMWTRACPETVLPGRRIGQLETGFEASFLVLAGNPPEDFANTRQLGLRVKNGLLLQPNEAE